MIPIKLDFSPSCNQSQNKTTITSNDFDESRFYLEQQETSTANINEDLHVKRQLCYGVELIDPTQKSRDVSNKWKNIVESNGFVLKYPSEL